jgi:hypothetical protein
MSKTKSPRKGIKKFRLGWSDLSKGLPVGLSKDWDVGFS